MYRGKILIAMCLSLALTGCSQFVKRAEFDSTVADLRSADEGFRSADAKLRSQLELMESRFGGLTQEMQGTFNNLSAQITDLQGRIRVDMTAHFGYDDATLGEDDKNALNEFSQVIRDFHPNILVTVEGFTDPAGSAEYNKWLGMQRAKSVREYLIASGIAAEKVRAVSYGEDAERQVSQGAWGDSGYVNRRVALVIDYIAS